MSENLTPKKQKAIAALLTSWDTTQAAQAAGVSRETIYKWMKEEPFKQALKEGAAVAMEGLSRSLVTLGDKAVKALSDALEGDSPLQAGARVRAADIVLSRLLALRELVDLEARITELESKVTK
jgi:phage terminase small subunit